MDGREQALEYIRFLRDRVPGYERAQLATFGVQIGVRETRRARPLPSHQGGCADGAAIRRSNRTLWRAIEDHHEGADTKWLYLPDGQSVGIPYRTLVPQQADNVLVAGRCFSATHDAHASVRSMGQCMAMGQAAGTPAALAAAQGAPVAEIDCAALQATLRDAGAILA